MYFFIKGIIILTIFATVQIMRTRKLKKPTNHFFMKRLFTLLICGLLSVATMFADEPFRNHRYDSFKVLETNNESIVFIGNSITDMHCWPEAFVTSTGEYLPIVNRGNSGTYSTEQSDNIESYINGKPKKVFMMIGTNDIATRGLNFTGEQVLQQIKSMVERIQRRSPQTSIYLYCILKSDYGYRVESTWLHANELIKEYVEKANSDKLTYVDIYDELACVADGGVWSYDKLHLTAAAYEIWCRSICKYLQEGEDYTVSAVYPSNTSSAQNNGGLGGSHGMRATYFSALPIGNDDVLVFGDEFIKNGEWQELLGNRNVKNRGTGWGYGGDIATTSKIVDATYANTGVEKRDAKAIFIYTGTGDCNGSTAIETVKSNYKALVDKVAQKSPTSKIYLMALCPTNNATTNTSRIAALNSYMQSLATGNISYVDTYTPMLNGNVANTKYFYPNNYLGGLGYVVMANAMMDALKADFPADTYNVISESAAETRYAQATLRNTLSQTIARGLTSERGEAMGLYDTEKMKAFDAELENAYTLLAKESITESEVQEMSARLTTILAEAISMPKASTAEEEYWYQITSLRSPNLFISAEGEATGVVGKENTGASAVSMWKFVDRGDNTFDIVNRQYGSYLSPVATYNTQITTTKSKPANGWTVSYANTPAYYIISSGEVQLNQTGSGQSYKLYNWSNTATLGSDRADTGCQLSIAEAGEIAELPETQTKTLTLGIDQFANGASTWSKHVSTSDGWYGKFVTGTDPALTVEGVDKNVNNIGWSQKRPWFQEGYTYTLSLPEGYLINAYQLTTLDANGFNGTFTYTTAEGTATSAAQTSTPQTVKAEGLSTRTITIKVGDGQTSTNGIMMTNLVIQYTENGSEEEVANLEFTIDKANGNLYHKDGAANQNWNCCWKSNATPQLQFGCGTINNMNWSGNNVQLMTGSVGSASYSITAPSGYVITEYSFTFANNGHNTGLELTMDNGALYTTSTTAQTISAKNQNTNSVSFRLAGNNGNGVVLTNFTVKIKEDKIEAPKISTEGDEHWYYITSASTQTYCAGKVIYIDGDMNRLRFGDKMFSADRIWSLWEKDGKIAIKNYKGEYFGTAGSGTGNSTAFGVVNEPNYIYSINSAYEFFVIKDNAVELHAQNDNSVIVRWGAAAGNASLWKFDEVDTSNALAEFASSRVVQGKVSTGIGNTNQPIVRSTIRIGGLDGSVEFQGVKGRFIGVDKNDITNVKAYFASNARELFIDPEKKMTWREENGEQFGESVTLAADGTFTITGSKTLVPGDNYLWITYDIAETAKEGNTVDAAITAYTIDGKEVAENNGNPAHSVTVFLSEGAVLMPMDKGSLYYRIPAITVTKDGKRLVTLTDDRKQHNSDLPSHCYLVAQYSEDNGRTWSDPVTVAGTAETGGNYGHGDASIVTNRDNGEIVGIMTSAGTYGHGFFAGTAAEPPRWKTITSRDGGLTWETPVDHTDDLFGANCSNPDTKTWKSGFSGSGAALQKRDGTLVSSFVNRQADNSQHFYFFMSKDGGQSWYVSGTSGTSGADEPKTLERNNGDLAISVRSSGYNYYNYTSNNGETWHLPSQTRFNSGISGNACDGEYMVWCSTVEGNAWDIAFQTLPNSGSRQNVSIALSTDEGATFGTPKTICPIGSAYSAAVVLPDGTLGVYYEENGVFGGFTMRFVRFSLDWASNGTYKFTDAAPFYPIKSSNPTTAIEEVKGESGKVKTGIYDLQGRKVTAPVKGLYIIDGKKMLLK